MRPKTPITYYGGKQRISRHIVTLLDAATALGAKVYAEPFAGGLAVLFAKEPHRLEVVSDTNWMIFNFWEMMRTNADALYDLIAARNIYSENYHQLSNEIYLGFRDASNLEKDWATWYTIRTSINMLPGSTFGANLRQGTNRAAELQNKIELFSYVRKRVQQVIVRNADAIKIINQFDSRETVFFIDPPYVGANQGHYRGYTQAEFDRLLHALQLIKGFFVLSHYDNAHMRAVIFKERWQVRKIQTLTSAASTLRGNSKPARTEWLVHNIPGFIPEAA